MPIGSALLLRHQMNPVTESYSPGEKVAPFLGSTSRSPTKLWKQLVLRAAAPAYGGTVDLEEMRPKLGAALLGAFSDEMAKIAYVPNTQGDKAGVLRALLIAMLKNRRFLAGSEGALAEEIRDQRRMYGEDSEGLNYAQAMQQRMGEQLMADTKLQATLEAMGDRTRRYVT